MYEWCFVQVQTYFKVMIIIICRGKLADVNSVLDNIGFLYANEGTMNDKLG